MITYLMFCGIEFIDLEMGYVLTPPEILRAQTENPIVHSLCLGR
jgi:hypothetical protein